MRSIYRIVAGTALAASLVIAQQPKSKGEYDALMAVQNAPDPDARIAAIESLLQKYADTQFKPQLLLMAAATAQQKNDYEKMMVYAERSLDADPKSFQAMLMLANGLASKTREFDLDREEKLGRADKYAHSALDALKTAAKPNQQMTDDQWALVKKDGESEAHIALGQIAMVRKKYDVAAQEYKAALDGAATPDPAVAVRLANAYNMLKQPDAAIAALDRIKTMTDVQAVVQNAANAERNAAIKLKGAAGGGSAATPAATPGTTATPATTPTPAPAAAPKP